MDFGNVLVIGSSGVGKSTLINAILGEHKAITGSGPTGTTTKLEIHESSDKRVPFRIIDTIGFEPSFLKRQKAIGAIKKWSKNAAKDGDSNTDINLIWFCVDGTSRKLFPDVIKSFSNATALWKRVPIIVVITKSYSEPERPENIAMVKQALEKARRFKGKEVPIIPVVAETYRLTDTAFVAPDGIVELIAATNDALPEGRKAAKKDIADYMLGRRRVMAQGVIGVMAAAGAAATALPLPITDTSALAAIEAYEVGALAKIYGVKDSAESKRFISTIVEEGTVGAAAKTLVKTVGKYAGGKASGPVLNAVIAAAIVVAIGEGSVSAFEKVYAGEKTLDDTAWIKDSLQSLLSGKFAKQVADAVETASNESDESNVSDLAARVMQDVFSNTQPEG